MRNNAFHQRAVKYTFVIQLTGAYAEDGIAVAFTL